MLSKKEEAIVVTYSTQTHDPRLRGQAGESFLFFLSCVTRKAKQKKTENKNQKKIKAGTPNPSQRVMEFSLGNQACPYWKKV